MSWTLQCLNHDFHSLFGILSLDDFDTLYRYSTSLVLKKHHQDSKISYKQAIYRYDMIKFIYCTYNIYVYIYMYMRNAHTYLYMYIYMRTHTDIYIYVYVCIHVCQIIDGSNFTIFAEGKDGKDIRQRPRKTPLDPGSTILGLHQGSASCAAGLPYAPWGIQLLRIIVQYW